MVLLAVATASAQITHTDQGSVDKKAAEVLKKAESRFEKPVMFTVKMTALDSEKKSVSQHRATVKYSGEKYRMEASDQEVMCDGKTVWHWNKGAKEVTVSTMGDEDANLLNPGRLLANYGKSFRTKYIRTEEDGTAVVDLQPKAGKSYHKIRLLIDEKSGLLKQMEVHKYDSSREVYEVSGFQALRNVQASMFVFDEKQHPGVEVIDMR